MDSPCPRRRTKAPNTAPNSSRTPRTPGNQIQIRVFKKKTIDELAKLLGEGLRLSFTPENWQVRCIKEILEKKDVIVAAGTGYGKSLIFEGLALFNPRKIVIVVCPLKALELDQAQEAVAKGLNAQAVNEDSTKTVGIWENIRKGTYRLVYISPEMALSVSFKRLWTCQGFREKVATVVVDEAHCIEEWGADFRKAYEDLATLRIFVGHEIPFLACSATITTHTFDVIWRSLQYGFRPMWGIDVGCSRPELSYDIRVLDEQVTPAKQIWDLLSFLREANDDTPVSGLKKTLIYFPTKLACRKAKRMLREHLPRHLGHTVQSFTSLASNDAKEITFQQFAHGEIRILCATEAAGMGCNVKNIEVVVVVGTGLKSLSVLVQRWGRCARGFGMLGECVLLMPSWAWEPAAPISNLAGQIIKTRAGKGRPETKRYREMRAGLQHALRGLINLKNGCTHRYIETVFRPQTGLVTFSALERFECIRDRKRKLSGNEPDPDAEQDTTRSQLVHTSTCWIALTGLKRSKDDSIKDLLPPFDKRCCSNCVPSLNKQATAASGIDEQLRPSSPISRRETIDPSWIVSPRKKRGRAGSLGSVTSAASESSAGGRSSRGSNANLPRMISFYHVDQQAIVDLRNRLWTFRDQEFNERKDTEFFLTPNQILSIHTHSLVVGEARRWLSTPDSITPSTIRACVQWDLAEDAFLERLAYVIRNWVRDVKAKPKGGTSASASPRKGAKRKQPCLQSAATRALTVDAKMHNEVPPIPLFLSGSTPSVSSPANQLEDIFTSPVVRHHNPSSQLTETPHTSSAYTNTVKMYAQPYPSPYSTPHSTGAATDKTNSIWVPNPPPSAVPSPMPFQRGAYVPPRNLATSIHSTPQQQQHPPHALLSSSQGVPWITPPASRQNSRVHRPSTLSQSLQEPASESSSDDDELDSTYLET